MLATEPKSRTLFRLKLILAFSERSKLVLWIADQFKVNSRPLFWVVPKFLYWISYPVPATGNAISKTLALFTYASNVPANFPFHSETSKPRLRMTIVSHFKSAVTIIFDTPQELL